MKDEKESIVQRLQFPNPSFEILSLREPRLYQIPSTSSYSRLQSIHMVVSMGWHWEPRGYILWSISHLTNSLQQQELLSHTSVPSQDLWFQSCGGLVRVLRSYSLDGIDKHWDSWPIVTISHEEAILCFKQPPLWFHSIWIEDIDVIEAVDQEIEKRIEMSKGRLRCYTVVEGEPAVAQH